MHVVAGFPLSAIDDLAISLVRLLDRVSATNASVVSISCSGDEQSVQDCAVSTTDPQDFTVAAIKCIGKLWLYVE